MTLVASSHTNAASHFGAASSGGGGGGGGGTGVSGGSNPALEERRRRQAELATRNLALEEQRRLRRGPQGAAPPPGRARHAHCVRWIAPPVGKLSKPGPPGELTAALVTRLAGAGVARGGPEIPQALGSINAVVGQAFFVPLYDLFLTYGGIFRLNFGPKLFLIVSDLAIAKHILRDNSKAYSKGILAEILEFVMGMGLIPADGEIWRVRRRAIVPTLHRRSDLSAYCDLVYSGTRVGDWTFLYQTFPLNP